MTRKIAIAGFTLATAALLLWLLANAYMYSGAEWDCADWLDKQLICADATRRTALIRVMGGSILWAVLGLLTFRHWKRR